MPVMGVRIDGLCGDELLLDWAAARSVANKPIQVDTTGATSPHDDPRGPQSKRRAFGDLMLQFLGRGEGRAEIPPIPGPGYIEPARNPTAACS